MTMQSLHHSTLYYLELGWNLRLLPWLDDERNCTNVERMLRPSTVQARPAVEQV